MNVCAGDWFDKKRDDEQDEYEKGNSSSDWMEGRVDALERFSRTSQSILNKRIFANLESQNVAKTDSEKRISSLVVVKYDINNFQCYISNLTDPWTNLAVEEWHTDPSTVLLYLWRNIGCVVIGRNQNPWKECNVRLLRNDGIPIIRRKSGGGTVFHDLGNTNYTVITPRQNFTRKHSAELVARALRKRLDIPAHVNERHDIEIEGLKISNIVSKGVESVLSPVTKLRNYSLTVNHKSFCDVVLQEFFAHYRGDINNVINSHMQPIIVEEELLSNIPKIIDYRDELKSWDWTFGQTPEFSLEFEKTFPWGHVKAFIKSKNGFIYAITLSPSTIKYENLISTLEDSLEGTKYDLTSVSQSLSTLTLSDIQLMPILNDLKNWIQDSL
ncbi:8585_t:CDS:10 [Racocetra persica]|uniref:8585_t:CDS:1 n=1 Tax=Racocetra persica TaxID=160502 RepID=A0ACA9K873_9GLOM|nr:8585_t:CDS:10 [Racocetra persica]